MRLLAVVRLSDLTDETTSPERQRTKITTYARLHEHEVIGLAEDLDVSGSISPFERPKLGPWLGRPDDWDGLIVAKYDRLTRSLLDFLVLYKWLADRGKTLIWIDPPLDFSTPFGKAMANVLITFAELELAVISDRIREAWHTLREAGKWPGGTVPFGRIPVRAKPNGWRLALDPEYAPVIVEMVRRYLSGDSFHMLSRWLNADGIPSSRDAQRLRSSKPTRGETWTPATVRKLLASPSLAGHVLSGGEPLRDRDGLIVSIDPLIPLEDYERLQAALRDRAYGRRVNASRLLQVAFCAFCSSQLHTSTFKNNTSRQFRYYICSKSRRGNCQTGRIPAEYLEKLVAQLFLHLVGGQEILHRVHIPAEDSSAELAAVDEAMRHLEEQYAAGAVYRGEVGAKRFAAMMTRLEERRDRLSALPSTPARIEYRPTGQTFANRWEEEDVTGRRQLMVDAGFQVRISRTPIPSSEIAAEARQLGISASVRQLRNRAANIRYMATKTAKPERLAALDAELAAVESTRHRLRGLRKYNEVISFALDEDLARRAGLAAAGKPVEIPDLSQEWDLALAPVREAFGGKPDEPTPSNL
jgi:DNA invertase Pin-like site-specific DNA recombinase